MQRLIVTDLTRFSNTEIVCTAGIEPGTGKCIRPMPYLPTSECRRLNLLPGTILEGSFSPERHLTGPHREDMRWNRLASVGSCTSDEFQQVLQAGVFPSIADGFEIHLAANQKHIPIDHPVDRSLITIEIRPSDIFIVEDTYKPGTLKLHFHDGSGHAYRFMPITDLGFHAYAEKHHQANDLRTLEAFIRGQHQVYLRIGLSRQWNNGSTDGYWIQVNGVYTFPDYQREIRSYR